MRKRECSEYTGHKNRIAAAKQGKRQHEAYDYNTRGNKGAKNGNVVTDSEGRTRDLIARDAAQAQTHALTA